MGSEMCIRDSMQSYQQGSFLRLTFPRCRKVSEYPYPCWDAPMYEAAATHTFEAITTVFSCAGEEFTTKGKTVLSAGWKEIERRFAETLKGKPEEEAGEPSALPELFKEQTFEHPAARITAYDTTPPKPHNEALLLSAMERAGNEETDPDAERRGLGTPATLVAVIEKLINGGFVTRKGKQLLPIKGGINLVCVLPETLTSPKLTAE